MINHFKGQSAGVLVGLLIFSLKSKIWFQFSIYLHFNYSIPVRKKIEMSLSKFNFKVSGIKNVRISKKQDRKKERQDLLKKAIPVLDLEQKSGKKRKMSASKVLNLCSELNLRISTEVSIPTTKDLDQGKV